VRGPRPRRRIVSAADEARRRLEHDLHDGAHGIHPSQLSARGVAAALGELAARAPVPVSIVHDLNRRLSSDIEAALYFSAAEAVTNAASTRGRRRSSFTSAAATAASS